MKKTVIGFLCLVAVVLLACKESDSGSKPEAAKGSGSISLMIPLYTPEAPAPDSSVWKALNELTGENLDIQFVPGDSYNDKLNVSIAAGELPHAFAVLDNKGNAFVSAARSGMIWELSSAIAASKNLSRNLDPLVLKNASIDGKTYSLPRTRIMVRYGFQYRKDWLEKLNLKVPETMDEVYEVIKAFATRDPDGNGKHDTFGLITATGNGAGMSNDGIWYLEVPSITMGGGLNWIEEGDGVIPVFMTKPHLEALRFYKRLYDEKLINQDFATIKEQKVFELLNAEQGGAFFGLSDGIMNHFNPLIAAHQKISGNPNLGLEHLWDETMKIKGSDGTIRLGGSTGFNGIFAFSKTTLKTESELQRVFNIFDAFDSEDGKNLMRWGYLGEDYEIRDGMAIAISPDTWIKNVQNFQQLFITGVSVPPVLKGERSIMMEKVEAEQIDSKNFATIIMDPTFPLISPTKTARGAELDKIIWDAEIQYVMGQITEPQYLAAIEQWQKSGGQLIIDEYNQAWKASN